MGSGYTDWTRSAISTIGTPKQAGWAATITPNVNNELITLSGQGVLWGGSIIISDIASQKNSVPGLFVDKQSMSGYSLTKMNDNNFNIGLPGGLLLTKYDDVNFDYAVAVSFQVPFMTELAIYFHEKHGNVPTVTAMLFATWAQ